MQIYISYKGTVLKVCVFDYLYRRITDNPWFWENSNAMPNSSQITDTLDENYITVMKQNLYQNTMTYIK